MERQNYWTRRMRRRRLLGGMAATGTGVAALALVGCGDDDDGGNGAQPTVDVKPGTPTAPTPTTPGEVVKRDGIYHARQNAPFANISPYNGLDSGLAWGLTMPIYDHLWYTPLDTGVRENFLADTIEQPDPLQITVVIKDAVFQNKAPVNGRKITSEDVQKSLLAAQKATKISNSSWWTQVLDTVEAPDERTIVYKLKQVDAWSFSSTNGGSPIAGSILPREHADDPSLMERDLIGSGLYEFVSHENGANFTLKRNETYRVKDRPNLAGIETKLIQEQAAAIAAFKDGQIDSVTPNNKLETDQLRRDMGDKIEIESDLSRAVWTVQPRGDGQWADPRVSQAISMALDRDEMIDLMGFGQGAKTGPVPPTFTSYALTEAELEETYGRYDPAEAKRLLAATAFDLSQEYELKFITPGDTYSQFAQIVEAQLERNLGFKIRLVGEDFGKWLSQSLYGSDYNGFIVNPSLSYDDPSSYIGYYTKEIGGRPNWYGFVNDELDKMVYDQKQELDDAAREKLVRELQLKAWDAGAPVIPTFVRVTDTVFHSYVKGRIVGRGSYGYLLGTRYIDKG